MTERNAPSSRVAWGLGIAIGLLLLGGIVLRQTAPVPDSVSAAGREASAIEVASFEVRGELRRDRALLPAVLEAKRSVRLASETEGRVLELGAGSRRRRCWSRSIRCARASPSTAPALR
jgi:hypothetical protein